MNLCATGLLGIILTICLGPTGLDAGMREMIHPRGFVLKVPADLEVATSQDGFNITPKASANLRQVWSISVKLLDQAPPGPWPETKSVNGASIHYKIDKVPGGSGGDLETLRAWRAFPTGYIYLEYLIQKEELSEHYFTLGWEILLNVEVTAPRK